MSNVSEEDHHCHIRKPLHCAATFGIPSLSETVPQLPTCCCNSRFSPLNTVDRSTAWANVNGYTATIDWETTCWRFNSLFHSCLLPPSG